MYNCNSYVPRAKADTSFKDSIRVEEEIVLDEDGNPVERQLPISSNKEQQPADQQQKEHKTPKEQPVSLDNL